MLFRDLFRACVRPSAASLALAAALAGGVAGAALKPPPRSAPPIARLLQTPLEFEPSQGQAAGPIAFTVRDRQATLRLSPSGIETSIRRPSTAGLGRRAAVRMRLIGANDGAMLEGADRQQSTVNYLVGRDPKRWRVGIPTYSGVREIEVYPGIDLYYHGGDTTDRERSVEYDFRVRPHADPGVIALRFEGSHSAHLDARGDLVLRTPAGELRHRKPVAYQKIGGRRHDVAASFTLKHGPKSTYQAAFRLGTYDPAHALVIDPVLSYCTMIAGSANEKGISVAMNAQGDCYVTGFTASDDLPVSSLPLQKESAGGFDAFVSCFRPRSGGQNSRLFTTYLGGMGSDIGDGIGVDSSGNIYVAGTTNSTDFPLVSPISQGPGAGGAFLASLTPDARHFRYSTTFGTLVFQASLAVTPGGTAYVAGTTASVVFPIVRGYQSANAGKHEAFLARIDFNGGAVLAYSTYLGGAKDDSGWAVAAGAGNRAYVTGGTASAGAFSAAGAVQAALSGPSDAWLAVVDTGLSGAASRVYATYLGGSQEDGTHGVSVDAAGMVYLTGDTHSPNFPGAGSYPPIQGGSAMFVSVLEPQASPAGFHIRSSLVIDGENADSAAAICQNGPGRVWITGQSNSPQFPNTDSTGYNGGYDVITLWLFMDPLDPHVIYGRFLGTGGLDVGSGIAIDAQNNVAVTGQGDNGFPTVNPYQAGNPGGTGAFLAYLQAVLPRTPTNLTAVVDSNIVINLHWQIQSTVEDGFEVWRKPDLNGNVGFGLIGTTGSPAFADFDIVRGGTYTYHVRASAQDGVGPFSNDATASVAPLLLPPPSPGGVTATAHVSGRKIVVHWTDRSTGPTDRPASFEIERRPDVNGTEFQRIGQQVYPQPTFEDDGVVPQSRYWYRVRAKNAAGYSDYSLGALGVTGVETFAIGGQILTPADALGVQNPIIDVEVDIEPGAHHVQTNLSGIFLLEGLSAGTYTVTPSFDGFDFTPASKTVTVGPSSTSVNFTATSGAPTIDIVLPADDDLWPITYKGPNVRIRARVTARGRVSWRVLLDSAQIKAGTRKGPNAINFIRKRLAEGAHSLRIIATGAGGGQVAVQRTFYVDRTPPAVDLFYPPAALGNLSSLAVSPVPFRGEVEDSRVEPHEAAATWSLKVDGHIHLTGRHELGRQAILSLADLSQGRHTAVIEAVDGVGNRKVLRREFRVTATNASGAVLELSPANGTLDAGHTPVGQGKDFGFSIKNVGRAALTWDTDLPFTQVHPVPDIFKLANLRARHTLQPGESTVVDLEFTPRTTGLTIGHFQLTSNDPSFANVTIGTRGTAP